MGVNFFIAQYSTWKFILQNTSLFFTMFLLPWDDNTLMHPHYIDRHYIIQHSLRPESAVRLTMHCIVIPTIAFENM